MPQGSGFVPDFIYALSARDQSGPLLTYKWGFRELATAVAGQANICSLFFPNDTVGFITHAYVQWTVLPAGAGINSWIAVNGAQFIPAAMDIPLDRLCESAILSREQFAFTGIGNPYIVGSGSLCQGWEGCVQVSGPQADGQTPAGATLTCARTLAAGAWTVRGALGGYTIPKGNINSI